MMCGGNQTGKRVWQSVSRSVDGLRGESDNGKALDVCDAACRHSFVTPRPTLPSRDNRSPSTPYPSKAVNRTLRR